MSDWYDTAIEQPVRDLVRHLRDNGINTECSCGHDMYVQCQLLPDGLIQRVHDLLFNYFTDAGLPVTYTVEARLECRDGRWTSSLRIELSHEA